VGYVFFPHRITLLAKGATLEINWDTDFGDISFIPSYSKRSADDVRNDVEIYFADDPEVYFTTQYGENYTETKQAELRITSPEDFPFKWIVGAVLYDEVRERLTDDYFYDENDSTMSISQDKTALYANITYPLTDRFRVNAGYRQSWDDVVTISLPPKVGSTGITGQDYSKPDTKVGIEYDMADNAMLYANYATSYRIDPMSLVVAGKKNDPQELTAYTAGAKSRFLDNTLQVNASAFYYDYYNKFFRPNFTSGSFGRGEIIIEANYPYTDPDTGISYPGTDFNNDGDFIDTNLRAGDERLEPGWSSDLVGRRVGDPNKQYGDFESYGVDVSVDWVPTPKDRVGLTVLYLHTEWTDAVMEYYCSWVWPDAGYDYGGRPETYSPEWSLHASYRHIFDLGSFGTLIPQVDVQYKAEYDVSFLEMYRPFSYQEAYAIWNAALTFNHASDRWSVNAYVKNIDEYAAKTFFNGRGSTVTLGLTDPQLYGVVVSAKF